MHERGRPNGFTAAMFRLATALAAEYRSSPDRHRLRNPVVWRTRRGTGHIWCAGQHWADARVDAIRHAGRRRIPLALRAARNPAHSPRPIEAVAGRIHDA